MKALIKKTKKKSVKKTPKKISGREAIAHLSVFREGQNAVFEEKVSALVERLVNKIPKTAQEYFMGFWQMTERLVREGSLSYEKRHGEQKNLLKKIRVAWRGIVNVEVLPQKGTCYDLIVFRAI
ncbi:MAG: hypothetical protein A2599_01950 [Candidatus Staskawiczbacteria bacterium RIFOXYD1_FULL_39_28]|uniref:Uncharacterized protein n=1 Tax=Candidatus Staskawiczbacteria bacterium RIFOXYC1_FULL_38_18 TaxID=1802229 RepID=A0A1G2JDU9_9BACT|nr:MAG: hypothetical protein A2401_00980 [Candidatus Staskawiczbacteria bacterium RIFOXYC1_FULL_38_18]OGZ91791.1 MAG: hypothetical protein A2599_01950 [Candidatus Staskawiczbacteria bacterium RIFOXYD1_FULL_39_28]